MIAQRLYQLVVLRLAHLPAVTVGREMMRLVEHHQIPRWRVLQALDACRPFQRIDTGDQAVVLGESVALAVRHVAFGAEDLEVEVEDLV